MKVETLPLEGLKIIQLDAYRDSRGFFVERFNKDAFREAGLPTDFVRDAHSFSNPGVLRGLHFQKNPEVGKLVGVARGRIWDIAVDLRPRSATFLKHYGVELSADNSKLYWIPPGFAHGYCVLGDESADIIYKLDNVFNPLGDSGIRWNDPELKIEWPVHDPILSIKDQNLPFVKNSIERGLF